MFSFVALCSLRVGTHERKSARCRQSSANEKHPRVPRSGFKSPEGFLSSPRLDPSSIARVPPRARPPARYLERARARDINSRARAPSSIPRARPHRPARRRVIHHHDDRSVDRDRRCRESMDGCRREIEIEIARARDARHAPVDIDVKRFLSHRRHDRRNESIDARVSF